MHQLDVDGLMGDPDHVGDYFFEFSLLSDNCVSPPDDEALTTLAEIRQLYDAARFSVRLAFYSALANLVISFLKLESTSRLRHFGREATRAMGGIANMIHLRFLWIFPFVSGTAWFLTLTILLAAWLGKGKPVYEGQRNPFIAFISDIGAFTLKPVFIAGCLTTGVFFIPTISAVHYARYSARMYAIQDSSITRAVSILSVISGTVAGLSISLLSILDTWRFHEEHTLTLLTYFFSLGLCAICTAFVYWDQCWRPSPFGNLRLFCLFSLSVVVIISVLSVLFIAYMYSSRWRTAGILEWCLSYCGALYIWAFIGFVAVPEGGIDQHERAPLLGDQAYLNAVENNVVRRTQDHSEGRDA